MSEEAPWQLRFPPFYTLQPNLETRKKQLEAWRTIVLDYCQKKGLTSWDLTEAANSELFNNSAIQRRLSNEALKAVFKELEENGNLEWTDKACMRCNIYWRSPDEWGTLIFSIYIWLVKQENQHNSIYSHHFAPINTHHQNMIEILLKFPAYFCS